MKKYKTNEDKTYVNKQNSNFEEYGGIYLLGSRKDVARLYQAMDVFVLPSRYEGLPVVAVEAQASGLPCILSDKITNEVQVTHLALFQDTDQTAEKWADVIERVAEHTEFYGRRERVYSEMEGAGFSIKKQGEKLQEYYKLLIHREIENY